ncbi:uncharacterized protein [Ptychodera flava]|uniref:uncharacterized protein n=1 Tax=Ptychodera flava TaxID=63121 RepID=UPI003969E211
MREIRSDNITNPVGLQRELENEIENWNQVKIHGFLLRKGIDGNFNSPAGLHFGGVRKHQIRTGRQLLKAIAKEQVLDYEGLETLLCDVEYIINSRPIGTPSDNVSHLEVLTPNKLLTMKGLSLSLCQTDKKRHIQGGDGDK